MKTTHIQPAPRHPSLINPAVPTRVIVLLDNTRLPRDTLVLSDGTYVLKDCIIEQKTRQYR